MRDSSRQTGRPRGQTGIRQLARALACLSRLPSATLDAGPDGRRESTPPARRLFASQIGEGAHALSMRGDRELKRLSASAGPSATTPVGGPWRCRSSRRCWRRPTAPSRATWAPAGRGHRQLQPQPEVIEAVTGPGSAVTPGWRLCLSSGTSIRRPADWADRLKELIDAGA
jgi:hypothetical protein